MKYLLAHEASRWTQSHYSQKAFEMINIESARRLLNKVSPEIVKHWEKEKGVGLAMTIAIIESIEDERIPDEDRISNCRKVVKILSLTFLLLFLTMGVLAYNYPHIKPVYPYTLIALIFVTMIAIACIQIHQINLSNKLWEYKQDRINQQEILSGKVNQFWDTILKVCEHNELPKNRLVDAEYLKDVLHVAIKDLLFKKAEYGVRRKNTSISLDNVAPFAFKYVNSGEYLNKQCTIVEDELGVKLDMGKMFAKASEEMKRSYPGYKEFFKTKEVEDGGTEKQEG